SSHLLSTPSLFERVEKRPGHYNRDSDVDFNEEVTNYLGQQCAKAGIQVRRVTLAVEAEGMLANLGSRLRGNDVLGHGVPIG
ncbi:hypothetical protein, partial [Massilia sp. Bi118]|uniref:hypothetical protein n=1 Tax=Massilia sp. Bi118 TaxID=2822346 RepID=UPI001E5770D7